MFDGGNTPRHAYSSRAVSSDDRGGSVLDYYGQVRSANVSRQTVAVDGYCASACTMKLAARNVCISPDATLRSLGFHPAAPVACRRAFASVRKRSTAIQRGRRRRRRALYPRSALRREWL